MTTKNTQPAYRYEKVTDYLFDLKEEFERGELFEMVGVEIYRKVKKERYLAESFFHETLYRRIELTERDLFIEEACKRCDWQLGSLAANRAGNLYDAGCRFVNGKG